MNDADALRSYLSGRDVPCPGCGYNLRGLPGDRCPECHQPLVLAVRLAEPKMAAWIAGLIALGCGAGFSGLLLAYLVIRSLMDRSFARAAEFFVVTAVPFAVFLPILIAWVRGRRRVQQWSPPARAAAAAGFWTLTLANLLVFTSIIN